MAEHGKWLAREKSTLKQQQNLLMYMLCPCYQFSCHQCHQLFDQDTISEGLPFGLPHLFLASWLNSLLLASQPVVKSKCLCFYFKFFLIINTLCKFEHFGGVGRHLFHFVSSYFAELG